MGGRAVGMEGLGGVGSSEAMGGRAVAMEGLGGVGSSEAMGKRAVGMEGLGGVGSSEAMGGRAVGMEGLGEVGLSEGMGEWSLRYSHPHEDCHKEHAFGKLSLDLTFPPAGLSQGLRGRSPPP
ncbi:hypothetical protein PoB_005103500 [Plakobranchus ocellatus]|uniref:Uncharacterized protein n=1 Tax=Plakobranchus ocellatus TaxID=259542 RepID=A0AAV4BYZ2_9GAST|nr:hypothetical protein PoB_005103500 [Plakobranchus ocellatus]